MDMVIRGLEWTKDQYTAGVARCLQVERPGQKAFLRTPTRDTHILPVDSLPQPVVKSAFLA